VEPTNWDDRLLRVLTPQRFWMLPAVWRYGLALLLAGIATVLRWTILPWIGAVVPYNVAVLAVVLATILLGIGPGLVCVLVSDVAVEVCILGSFATGPDGATLGRLGVSLAIGAFIVVILHSTRVAALKARQGAARLAAFASATSEGISESEAGRILDCNEQFARMLGYTVAELRGMMVADLIAPEDRDRIMANIQSNREADSEHAMLRKDGARLVVEAHGRPVTPASLRRHTVVRDVTARKEVAVALETSRQAAVNLARDATAARQQAEQAEQALRESEERLALAVSGTRIGIYDRDLVTGAIRATEQTVRLLGLRTTTTLSQAYQYHDWQERVHPEDLPQVESEMIRCMDEHVPFEMDYRVVWPDNSNHWLAVRSVFQYDGQGTPMRQLGILMDITERKHAEEQLVREKHLQQLLLDHFPGVVVLLRTTTREVVASNEAGRKVGAVCGSTCFLTWGQSQAPCPWCRAPELWATGKIQREVIEAGGKVWEAWWVPVTDELYLHYSTDITERTRHAQALQEKERTIQQALSVSRSFTFDWDTASDRVQRSESCKCIFGRDGDELATATAARYGQRIHPDDRQRFTAAIRSLTPAADTCATEYRLLLGDGSVLTLEEIAQAFFDSAGKPTRIIGMTTDITERKRMEDALRESEQRLKLAQQAGRIGSFEWNVQTGVNVWSPELEAMYGLEPEEFGKTQPAWEQLVHSEDRARAVGWVEQTFKTGEPVEGEWRVVWRDGSVHWVIGRFHGLRDGAGKPLRLSGVNIDITERKRAEERLKADLAALTRMHRLSSRVMGETGLESLLQEVMDAAVSIMGAERGTLQLVEGDSLRIAAHHGHGKAFLDFFERAEGRASVCGEATRRGERVVVEDVEQSALFAGTDSLPVLREAGVRAVQSTPMISRSGALLGILTTQWGRPHSPDQQDLWRIDLLVRQAADLIEQVKAQETLRESEARLRAVIEGAPLAMALTGRSGEIVLRNSRFDQLWGRPAHATTAVTYSEVYEGYHLDGRRIESEEWPAARSLLKGEVIDNEVYELVQASGQRITCWFGSVPIRNGSGAIVGAVVVFRDITRERRMEEALQDYRELLEMVINSLPMQVNLIRGSDLRLQFVNPAYQALAPGKQMVGRTLAEVWPETGQDFAALCRRVLETGETYHVEDQLNRIRRQPDGPLEECYFSWSLLRVRLPGEKGWGILNPAWDTTARHQVEAALRKSEERCRRVFSNNMVPMALWTKDGGIVDANDALLRMLGYARAELGAGDLCWDAITPVDYRQRDLEAIGEVDAKGFCTPYEKCWRHKDGRLVPIVIGAGKFDDHAGTGVLFAVDITERKQAEDALRAALHEKEVLLKEVHHRVKNNMQVLSSLASLQADNVEDPGTRDLFNDFRDQVRAMALVHESLYQAENLANIDFADYAGRLTASLARAYGRGNSAIRLTLDVEPVTLPVESAVPCGLILNELVTNAYKHAFRDRTAGEIVVRLRADPAGQVSLVVRDDGNGLPAGLDWRQAPSLGLRLVQMLTRQIRGGAECRRSEGGGTEFMIEFSQLTTDHR